MPKLFTVKRIMENLAEYYNTLLSIEVAVIGIIIAAIFVFFQLIYSKFSYSETKFILRDKYFYLFIFLSTLVLGVTALGSLSLSLDSHNYIDSRDFSIRFWIVHENTPFSLLLLLFATALTFFLLVFSNLKYLQPSKLLYLTTKLWRRKDIINYLYKKYGIKQPNEIVHLLYQFDDPRVEEVRKEIDEEIKSKMLDGNAEPQPKSEKRRQLEKDMEQEAKKHQQNLKVHRRLEESVSAAENPFQDSNKIALDAIAKLDVHTYKLFLSELRNKVKDFLTEIKVIENSRDWDPKRELPEHLARLLTDIFKSHIEIIEQNGLHSLKIDILEMTLNVASVLVEHRQYNALAVLASFWKRLAEHSMSLHPQIFKEVIKNFKTVTESLMRQSEKGEDIDEMFRDLGWLGEKLFLKESLEEQPLMPDDYEQSSVFDDFMNALLSFENIYSNSHPDWYPLVYFDAIEVVFLRLVDAIQEDKIKLKNANSSLFNLYYIYYSFAQSAIKADNGRGAELAAIWLNKAIEKLHEGSLFDRRNEAIDLLLSLGAFAAGHKYQPGGMLLGQTIDDWVIDKLLPYMTDYDISSEVLEIFIKGEGDRKEIKKYIVKLADRTGMNFRLNIEALKAEE